MKKKTYMAPTFSIFGVNASEIFCLSNTLHEGTGDGGWTNGQPIGGDASRSRNDWDDYEGKW